MKPETMKAVQDAYKAMMGEGMAGVAPGVAAFQQQPGASDKSKALSPEQIALALTTAIIRTPERMMAPAEAVRLYREALSELQATAEG